MSKFKQAFQVILVIVFTLGCFNVIIDIDALNDRPIIGILAMKITDKTIFKYFKWTKGKSYIGASYVKWLQSAGARIVPIRDNISRKNLTYLFKSINGILYPGGEVNLEDSGYYKTGKTLFHKIVKANNKGNYFPAMGICRGSQAIPVYAENDLNVLSETDSENISLPLKLTKDYKKTHMFGNISDSLKKIMTTEKIAPHYHKNGIKPEEFEKRKKLKKHFRILATNKDRKGKEFVSIFEGMIKVLS